MAEKKGAKCRINASCAYGVGRCCQGCARRARCAAVCQNDPLRCGLLDAEEPGGGSGRAQALANVRFDPGKLREARRRAGMTPEAAARRLGLSQASVLRRWETGERTPRAEMLYKICMAYPCEMGALFSVEGQHAGA